VRVHLCHAVLFLVSKRARSNAAQQRTTHPTICRDPAATWRSIAYAHARQVAANHIRPDNTTYHIVEYNPDTGAINARYTYQGHAADSTWVRGQAWALAGFAMLASSAPPDSAERVEFSGIASGLADAYLRLLSNAPAKAAAAGGAVADAVAGPLDGFVPAWDFDSPWFATLDGPRDTSAAAVAALGLLHLSRALRGSQQGTAGATSTSAGCADRYLAAGASTLRALASEKYMSPAGDSAFPSLLRHATGGFPLRHHVDVGLISGDYYVLMAAATCMADAACMSA
jgi:unsaturated chondroitin disaccharide hydrolase